MEDIYRPYVGKYVATDLAGHVAALIRGAAVRLALEVHGDKPLRSQVIECEQALIDALGDLLQLCKHDTTDPLEPPNLSPYELADNALVLEILTGEDYVRPPFRVSEEMREQFREAAERDRARTAAEGQGE